jgi:hypothetical protein
VLTEKQIREIEAQTMEFYGRQRVEAKKIMEKARINPNKGNKQVSELNSIQDSVRVMI